MGVSGSGPLKRLQSRWWLGLQSCEGLTGARVFASRVVHSHALLSGLAVGRRTQFLA